MVGVLWDPGFIFRRYPVEYLFKTEVEALV